MNVGNTLDCNFYSLLPKSYQPVKTGDNQDSQAQSASLEAEKT